MEIRTTLYLLLFLVVFQFKKIRCLDCYECSNIQNVSQCHTTASCTQDHMCSITSTGTSNSLRYSLGCRQRDQCPGLAQTTTIASVSIVGRDVVSQACDQCCATNACNKDMCQQHQNSVQCIDDPTFNCAQVSSVLNLCADIHHAKTVCREYCGLCSLVNNNKRYITEADGMWSNWNSWSSCSVSCGNGTITRMRLCNDPAPANGGLPCPGMDRESQVCSLSSCPVHGGWSDWTGWSSCSVSCSMGLQKKTRTCSNPSPSRFGDHCFGESIAYQACFKRACLDGGWSRWTAWSTCSRSCNGGQKTRSRTCNNPEPSMFGHECVGNSKENMFCNPTQCPKQHVAFSVYYPSSTLKASVAVSWHTITNIGGDFNTATGKFTCSIKGLYTFSVTVAAATHSTGYSVQCNVYHDNAQGHSISTLPHAIAYANPGSYTQGSTTTQLELSVGDTVYLHCSSWAYVYTGYTQFSGALISL